jgi:hypothetical protein
LLAFFFGVALFTFGFSFSGLCGFGGILSIRFKTSSRLGDSRAKACLPG